MPIPPAYFIALGVLLVAVTFLIVLALCRAAAIGDRFGRGPDDHTLRFENPSEIRARAREERIARNELRPRTGLVDVATQERPR